MKKRTTVILDILGISSATLCLIHCLLFPIITILPLGLSHNHWVDLFFACIGMFVVSKIILSNTTKLVKIILSLSISIIIVGVVIELLCNRNTYLVIIGGIIMIIGHYLNYKSHLN
ncbi:MerC mercury resistance protein [Flavobacterium psychrophilum]|uniref:MerC family mercury resistance protein n=1 Tax=Flavobacterium psychrophilum TaxID=96345 RepID=UPI000B7C18CE|nr:MerC family mercury resistance protein [Flavobacterium psychrophilum]SNB43832.1 MerC mercury resistance protein [Flavobacterium psychrophilum]